MIKIIQLKPKLQLDLHQFGKGESVGNLGGGARARSLISKLSPDYLKILTENVAKSEIDKIFNNVSILSFNYDRCIEHYLYEALQVYYGLDTNKTVSLMRTLKIFHPYGYVGKLPWQEFANSTLCVPFGSEKNNVLELSKQIKTFNERVHEADEIREIRDTIQQAEIIVFLGFAFHRQNLELIKPTKACKAKRVYATAYVISKSDCDVIRDELQDMLQQKQEKASIEFRNDLKCGALFKDYWRSLTAGL